MTRYIDVCNGDADGLCAVVQWRLHQPQIASLVTGLKRDIELLERVQAQPGDEVLVCDLSMRRNRSALSRLLDRGVRVSYFDHHEAGGVLVHPLLAAHVNTASTVCTSLLVDRYLGGRFRAWALVGAYGDNLAPVADAMAVEMGLGAEDRQRLKALGEAINYNAYGDSVQDTHITPEHLYQILIRYLNPFDLLAHESIGQALVALRLDDLTQAGALAPQWETPQARAYLLPDAPWSRRVIGTLINRLAISQPTQAHAILKPVGERHLMVSVRAPLSSPQGASNLCRQFGGDGRVGAAGIDRLPAQDLNRFIATFFETCWENTAFQADPS